MRIGVGTDFPERIDPEDATGGSLTSHLARYQYALEFCRGGRVLDVACGIGYGSHILSESAAQVIGVDLAADALTTAHARYESSKVSFTRGDAQQLPLGMDRFDTVVSFETLEHVPRPESFVAEIARVLCQDGTFVVSTPHVWRTDPSPDNPYHEVEFDRADFQGILSEYFDEVEILGQRRRDQSLVHWLLQRLDVLDLRRHLPSFVTDSAAQATGTKPWTETTAEDFVIDDERLFMATELVGVCRRPRH